MSEPLLCPFCGIGPRIMPLLGTDHKIMCVNRRCQMNPSVTRRSLKEAVQAWNTRAVTDRERTMVEAMSTAYGELCDGFKMPVALERLRKAIQVVEPDWSPT